MNKIFFFLIFLVLSSLAYAAPPTDVISTATTGIDIDMAIPDYHKINQPMTISFHNYNKSNGFIVSYDVVNCTSQLYTTNGSKIMDTKASTVDNYFRIIYGGNNFSIPGIYSVQVHCNNSDVGGFVRSSFEVTDTGDDPTQNAGQVLVFGLFILAFFLIYLSNNFKIEGNHAAKALISGILNLMLKLSSFGVIVFNVFFIKQLLPNINGMSSIYDTFMTIFLYGVVLIFFVMYFIHQFILLLVNMNIAKHNKEKERFER